MKDICFLFRYLTEYEEEFEVAKSCLDFPVYKYRSDIPNGQTVIGRYSVLPFYRELEKELEGRESKLINSFKIHEFIASLDYVHYIKDLTPDTYFTWAGLPEGSYVVKGRTNSRKQQWKDQMFAPTKEDVSKVVGRILDDTFIREQGVVVRKFEKLITYDYAINGLPVTNEWRFFCFKDKVIDWGYYWANFSESQPYPKNELPEEAHELVKKITDIFFDLNFYVVDIGQKENGDWIVIELNDGQMSGLSTIDPKEFYYNFNNILKENENHESHE